MDIQSFSEPFIEYISEEISEGRLQDPSSWFQGNFTWCSIPLDVWLFVDEESGTITVTKDDIKWKDFDISSCFLKKEDAT
jgi:hypothetical protein